MEGVKKVLLIALSLSEREGRGGGWRDNVIEESCSDRKRQSRRREEAEHTAKH